MKQYLPVREFSVSNKNGGQSSFMAGVITEDNSLPIIAAWRRDDRLREPVGSWIIGEENLVIAWRAALILSYMKSLNVEGFIKAYEAAKRSSDSYFSGAVSKEIGSERYAAIMGVAAPPHIVSTISRESSDKEDLIPEVVHGILPITILPRFVREIVSITLAGLQPTEA